MTEPSFKTLPEVLISPRAPGQHVASNPFVRTHAVGDERFVELLGFLTEPHTAEEVETHFEGREMAVTDAGESPFKDGLLGDPTGLEREIGMDGLAPIPAREALELAARLMLVCADEAAYAEHLRPRKNLLDRANRGNLHQRVAEHVLFELRERELDEWWANQKFSEDRREPRSGPYRFVQWEFMQSQFPRERVEGMAVFDFGCGPGLFTRLLARNGATVVAADTNPAHLETADRLLSEDGVRERVTLAELTPPFEDTVASVAGGPFDLILLSDVLMFYFYPYDERADLDPVRLLKALAGLLAPDGTIAVLEPHGAFWQTPRLGAQERPFTVITEYRRRRYGVTPTLEEMSEAVERAGLVITRIREPAPAEAEPGRAAAFASEFPLWWYFELRRAPK